MASKEIKTEREAVAAEDSASTSSTQSSTETRNKSLPSVSDTAVNESPAISNPRLDALAAKQARLEETLASLQAQRSSLVANAKLQSSLPMPDNLSEEERTAAALANAKAVIKKHSDLLHKYNEIRDIGQGLMGLIADQKGVRMATVMEDYGMSEKD